MTAPDEEHRMTLALEATCGLGTCRAAPGEPCVDSVDDQAPRDEPHWNRVVRGMQATASPPIGSTSAQLRQTQTALAASQADLTRVEEKFLEALHELAHVRYARDMATTRLTHWRERALKAEAELASAQQQALARLRTSLHTEEAPSV